MTKETLKKCIIQARIYKNYTECVVIWDDYERTFHVENTIFRKWLDAELARRLDNKLREFNSATPMSLGGKEILAHKVLNKRKRK